MKNMKERILFEKKGYPVLQNRVYDSPAEAMACSVGDILLVQNETTGLVYNKAFVPDRVVYDKNYNNEQSISQVFQSHLQSVCEIVEEYLGTSNLIEIGCGKGSFLQMLRKRGADIRGFDPTYEGHSTNITPSYYDERNVAGVVSGFVLRHVLEHIPNPIAFLENLRSLNQGSGLVYIEVPCMDWICARRSWQDVFYEHVNYFRSIDFERMFTKVMISGHIFDGQYIYVIADLKDLVVPSAGSCDHLSLPNDFFDSLTMLDLDNTRDICIWGAASKGVIFSIFAESQGISISTAIDINPAKQGKYMPVTGIPIVSPSRAFEEISAGTQVIIMNPNYENEIRDVVCGKFELFNCNGGRC
jgi:hypothetical protein